MLLMKIAEPASTRWSDALSERTPGLGWCEIWFTAGRLPNSGSRLTRRTCLRPDSTHWRRYRLVLWWLDVASSRLSRFAGRRNRSATRSTSCEYSHRRHTRFLCVVDFVPDKLLRLEAEMKVPGRAWLELKVTQSDPSKQHSTVRQTAILIPSGFLGSFTGIHSTPPTNSFLLACFVTSSKAGKEQHAEHE